MGGVDKGALRLSGGGPTILERLLALGRTLDLEVVLVGAGDQARHEVRQLSDEPPGVGPLGGLASALRHAGCARCIVLACDMPYLTAPLLRRLVEAPAVDAVLAARDRHSGKWQAFFARYEPGSVQPALEACLDAGERSFQALFARLPVTELALSDAEVALLADWDRPEDVV